MRSPGEVYAWAYLKAPYAFPLIDFPGQVTVEPTNDCNFACRHCPRSVMARAIGYMELELFRKIVEEMSAHPLSIMKLGGLGEPATHPRFGEFMEIIREHTVPAVIYTNGTLFGNFPHQQILGWRVPRLIVSIDGIDGASFERIRVGGKYDEVRERVADFYAAKKSAGARSPQLEIRHVIFPAETEEEIARFKASWLEVADTVKFNYLLPAGPVKEPDPSRPKCRDVRREFYIRWNGMVPLCGYQYLSAPREWLGNVSETAIAGLWRHPRLEQVRKLHRERDLSTLPFCQTCAFR